MTKSTLKAALAVVVLTTTLVSPATATHYVSGEWSAFREIHTTPDAWDLELDGSADGDHATMAWINDYGILVSSTLDGGDSWSSPQNLDVDADDGEVAVSADGTTVLVAYEHEEEGGGPAASSSAAILVSVGTADGSSVTFSSPLVIDGSSGGHDPENAISADGNEMAVVWITASDEIAVAESEDGGNNWSTTVVSSVGAEEPMIVMSRDGSRMVVTWEEELGSSGDGTIKAAFKAGTNWSDPIAIAPETSDADDPRIAMSHDGQHVVATWEYEDDDQEYEFVQISVSNNGGVSWSSPLTVSDDDIGLDADDPAVAMSLDGEIIVIAFEREVAYDNDGEDVETINSVASHDGGQTWSSPQQVSDSSYSSSDPFVDISNDGIRSIISMEAWPIDQISMEVSGARSQVVVSNDRGSTWKSPVNVSELYDTISRTKIALSDDGRSAIHVWNSDDYDAGEEYIESANIYSPLTCDANNGHPFTDVAPAAYMSTSQPATLSVFPTGNDVDCIFRLGVTTGTSSTTYSPAENVTREQMAAFLARMYEEFTGEDCIGENPFSDVAETSFAHESVGCIAELGVTTGTSSTTYSPAENVTREQMAAFLARLWRLVA